MWSGVFLIFYILRCLLLLDVDFFIDSRTSIDVEYSPLGVFLPGFNPIFFK